MCPWSRVCEGGSITERAGDALMLQGRELSFLKHVGGYKVKIKKKKKSDCLSLYLQESLRSTGNMKRKYCRWQHSSAGGGVGRKAFAQTGGKQGMLL